MKVKCRNPLCGEAIEWEFYLKPKKNVKDVSSIIFLVKCKRCNTISSYSMNPNSSEKEDSEKEKMLSYVG